MSGQTFVVMLPLRPLALGTPIDRSAWPLHVTLVGNFSTEAPSASVEAIIEAVAGALDVQQITVGQDAWFGPGQDIHVDLVSGPGLVSAHFTLLDALESKLDLRPRDPAFDRDGYRPHITRTRQGQARQGERYALAELALVEIAPDGDTKLAVPLAAFSLA